jgi:hypothetical protein
MNRYDIALGKDPPKQKELRPPQPKEKTLPKKVNADARESQLSELFRTAGGRMQLAASMAQPLRQRMVYGSIARRALRVESLFAGALPVYDHFSGARAVDESGQNIITLPRFGSGSNSAIIPFFEVSSNPTILLTQLRERRYDLIERAQDSAFNQLKQNEESLLLRIFNSMTDSSHIFSGPMTLDIIADSFALIEEHDLRVANFFMNLRGYEAVNRLGNDLIDHNGQRDLIQGFPGFLWGAQIILSENIPQGEFYVTAEPEFVGVLPVRTDLTVLPADDPGTVGWSIFENIGMACHNPMGVVRITSNPQTLQTGRVDYPDRASSSAQMTFSAFISGLRANILE